MALPAVTARMPTSAPGSRRRRPRDRPPRGRAGRVAAPPAAAAGGFTLIELLVVMAIIAVAVGVATLALRDPAEARLEHDADRLVVLLEAARANARASGLPARWEPVAERRADGADFAFIGAATDPPLPTRWLDRDIDAQVIGARAVALGPEPLIGEQRIVLRLGDRRLALATDGVGPFALVPGDADVAR